MNIIVASAASLILGMYLGSAWRRAQITIDRIIQEHEGPGT